MKNYKIEIVKIYKKQYIFHLWKKYILNFIFKKNIFKISISYIINNEFKFMEVNKFSIRKTNTKFIIKLLNNSLNNLI